MALLDPSETFNSLAESVGLDIRLRKAVQRMGHVRPTLVQSKCLPLAINSGRDLLVRAKTGSGKTLAYCLPVLQKILQAKDGDDVTTANTSTTGVRAIILVPTRELCSQVHAVMKQLIYYCDEIVSIAVLSAKKNNKNKNNEEYILQRAMLRDNPDIIISTPSGFVFYDEIKTNHVQTIVIDEADLMFHYGYYNDIQTILQKTTKQHYQSFLLSATLSNELKKMKKLILNSPIVLQLEDDSSSKDKGKLTQFYVSVPKQDKKLVVYVFLKLGLLKGKGIFFVNTTDGGYRLKLLLEQFHIRSSVLNAELPFRSRMNIIEQFNIGNFDYLIATDESTDVGANDEDDTPVIKGKRKDEEYGVSRGLDFRNVSFVVNVDFPPSATSYAHRVGRTARGGAKGVALSFVERDSASELAVLDDVQADQPKISLANSKSGALQSVTPTSNNNEAMQTESSEQAQPTPLDFDLKEIEGFRYRVEDVSRAVTRTAVKETRAAELRAEILNSERLQSHFEENPADLQILRHDRVATHISKVQDHLKHVPKYLLPRGMQAANLNKKRKRKRIKGGNNKSGLRRSDNDPLQTFDADVNLDGLGADQDDGGYDDDDMPDFNQDDGDDGGDGKKQKSKGKVYTSTHDGLGESTAGRNAWKEKHRKGKFSNKKRKSERKMKRPLGI
mmetsp:Transcript_15164/g.42744  ORF Transcript_15164/g.42744 Transcript_15164/m.42744 type:complete len:671 (+) Transcript_15164:144-2156(+)